MREMRFKDFLNAIYKKKKKDNFTEILLAIRTPVRSEKKLKLSINSRKFSVFVLKYAKNFYANKWGLQ